MSGLVVLTCGCGAKLLDEDREPGWRCPECAGSSRLWNDGYDRGLRDAIDLGRDVRHAREPEHSAGDRAAEVVSQQEGERVSEKAKRAVQAILADLTDRRGLRQAWESIDKDIRKDIVAEWAKLIDKSMGEK